MPIANIKVINGVFNDADKQQMIEKVTEAMVEVEGEGLREQTVVIVEEAKSGVWGVGGRPLTTQVVKNLRAGN